MTSPRPRPLLPPSSFGGKRGFAVHLCKTRFHADIRFVGEFDEEKILHRFSWKSSISCSVCQDLVPPVTWILRYFILLVIITLLCFHPKPPRCKSPTGVPQQTSAASPERILIFKLLTWNQCHLYSKPESTPLSVHWVTLDQVSHLAEIWIVPNQKPESTPRSAGWSHHGSSCKVCTSSRQHGWHSQSISPE